MRFAGASGRNGRLDRDEHAPLRRRADMQPVPAWVQRGQAPRDVAEPYARVRLHVPPGGKSHAVVPHAEHEAVAADAAGFLAHVDIHASADRPRSDAVLDRVLHERLEEEAGHQRAERAVVGPHRHDEPVPEPRPLDGEVGVEERQLLAERDFRPGAVVERGPEQLAQFAP
jgi:hypothetical protein